LELDQAKVCFILSLSPIAYTKVYIIGGLVDQNQQKVSSEGSSQSLNLSGTFIEVGD
jgi:hypothetical protein